MICGDNIQCLFDLNVTGETDFAMETLDHGQETEDTRDTIGTCTLKLKGIVIFMLSIISQ
mgnify:CR=1 FL=1